MLVHVGVIKENYPGAGWASTTDTWFTSGYTWQETPVYKSGYD
jgi:hypothetical protein